MFASIDLGASPGFRGDMMMLAGIAMLIWVLFRRNIRARRQRQREGSHAEAQRKAIEHADSAQGAPLASAPIEVLRWQSAMFDLQRELKAELETKIAVVQSMVRLADERIAALRQMHPAGGGAGRGLAEAAERVAALTRAGRSAQEVAAELALPVEDVEFLRRAAPIDASRG